MAGMYGSFDKQAFYHRYCAWWAVCWLHARSPMPYRTAGAECLVHLIMLRALPLATVMRCHALRQEAGRLWTDLVEMHSQARLRGQYALGSQTVQALCQRLA